MKKYLSASILFFLLISCSTTRNMQPHETVTSPPPVIESYELITESLFSDKDANISEDNIQKILNGKFKMPQKARVAIVNLENTAYRYTRWDNEDFLSSRERYLQAIIKNLEAHPRVASATLVPAMLLASKPTLTNIRESAVRMQADLILVYNISGGTYQNYKLFKANEYKAFANTQAMIMDTQTGLIPFTKVVSDEYHSRKDKDDFNEQEAEKRTQVKAVELTLEAISTAINEFLHKSEF